MRLSQNPVSSNRCSLSRSGSQFFPERCGPSVSSAPPKATRTSTRQRSAGKSARINTNNHFKAQKIKEILKLRNKKRNPKQQRKTRRQNKERRQLLSRAFFYQSL
jgi:hypothetical protein